MIRFRCDDESCLKQGNKEGASDKVRNLLRGELIFAIIAFSLSMNLKASGYQAKADQIFTEIKAARTAKTYKKQ